MNPLPGLDGLRAVAVLLVIFFHLGLVSFGWIGVQLFFVLSGFLITGLLIEYREGRSLGGYLRLFYARRTLRIFPLYYLYLAILSVVCYSGLALPQLADDLPFAFSYLYDFYVLTDRHESTPYLHHFWSLAVEEQFYLVWPLFIYFTPRRWLRPAMLGIVALGPAIRSATLAWWPAGATSIWIDDRSAILLWLPTSHLDAFACGALLCFEHARPRRLPWLASMLMLGAMMAGALWHRAGIDAPALAPPYRWILGVSLLNLCFAQLIHLAKARRLAPGILDHAVSRYIGRISYGLYVLHLPLIGLMSAWLFTVPDGRWACAVVIYFVVVFAAAGLSFRYYEQPFLRMKQRFQPA